MNISHVLRPVPARDWLSLLLLFAGIVIFIGLAEALRKKLNWPQEFTRKLVHIAVGVLMFFSPILLEASLPLVLMASFFTVTNYLAMKKGWLKGMESDRESYGTTLYPLAFLILVLFTWENQKVVLIASMLVLAIGDAMAAIVGESVKRPHTFRLVGETKSLEGSAAMFISSTLVVFLTLWFFPFESSFPVDSPWIALWFAGLTAIVATAAEALSTRGSDNLTVPLFAALILYYLLNHDLAANVQLTLGTLLGGLVALLSFRARFLDASGAVATFLLAVCIFGFGGWQWTIPILTFFILSSLLSKIGKRRKAAYEPMFEKGSRRDYAQVLANGGVAGALMVLYMFFPQPEIYLFYLAALAAATADTWATEIGVMIGQQPRLIRNFKPVMPGTSGGITLAGSLGAIAGAFVLALSGSAFLEATVGSVPVLLGLITGSGFLGNVVDSYLGATVQIQYRCPVCQKITEKSHHCNGTPTTPYSGVNWMNNDMVNFLNTVSAVGFLYVGRLFI
ncbi:MAG: DUF92 domain-containing protein [Calditrichaeota bacterium]|nr:DUF92 domain-containing protein [Calditrichota bacterium]